MSAAGWADPGMDVHFVPPEVRRQRPELVLHADANNWQKWVDFTVETRRDGLVKYEVVLTPEEKDLLAAATEPVAFARTKAFVIQRAWCRLMEGSALRDQWTGYRKMWHAMAGRDSQ